VTSTGVASDVVSQHFRTPFQKDSAAHP
jgi:hypothetical protein